MVLQTAVENAGRDDSDEECQNEDLVVAHEDLEDDAELRLHILGLQSYWTQPLVLPYALKPYLFLGSLET